MKKENKRSKACAEMEDFKITVFQSVHKIFDVLFSHI